VPPANLKSWKKQFLDNASLAFDKSAVVKEYKEKIAKLEKEHSQLAKKVGTLTIERDWLAGGVPLAGKSCAAWHPRAFPAVTCRRKRDWQMRENSRLLRFPPLTDG